ncbi:hypothetical protein [Microbacterium sp. 18062]|uniref:hypothetical protein n=1 Tax=Microbacterium sp. 18062 TaxID=2681410 RepID=UPI001359FF9D|nr:hypothetical protein [Microbacterium sp. 18062]
MARGSRTRIRFAVAAVAAVAALALSGCGLQIPADPDGTLDRITGGVLRVGASPADELVRVSERDVSGPLPDLIEGFADERDARVEWTVGSEEDLVDDLVAGALDLAIGGMTDATPWVDAVSVSRGYSGVEGSGGASVVVLMPMGENALQAALERYLDAEVGG